ncbi:aldolase/citrate lyase family protein [Arthrobacter sp. AK01]|uniref:HpcH/HpaI aldolase family protein n=1 Tax=Arthrobacter sp. AK01 TaxID=2894084 RepID=UPI001E2D3479|nr:aldolase/citrate lyase family protein [Arthrobacter sp. AK01]MCD4850613.1 aldolase/citrate lyase family protein [Arthrobacter sp. AK01]
MNTETTPLLRNPLKEKLSKGEPVFSMTVRLVRTIDIASIAYTAGFESIYIDMEHSSFPLESAGQICMACNALGVTPLVRVPGLDAPFIAKVMDAGAMGIIVPGVQSADEARAAVRAVKHAPMGIRSFSGAAPQLNYQSLPADKTIRELDQASLVVAMIESRAGLEVVDDIAAVEGVDMLLVGASDLSAELGFAGQVEHPEVHKAFLRVIEACQTHGKAIGIGGLGGRPDLVRQYLELGAGFVSTGNDITFLSGAASQKRKQFV